TGRPRGAVLGYNQVADVLGRSMQALEPWDVGVPVGPGARSGYFGFEYGRVVLGERYGDYESGAPGWRDYIRISPLYGEHDRITIDPSARALRMLDRVAVDHGGGCEEESGFLCLGDAEGVVRPE